MLALVLSAGALTGGVASGIAAGAPAGMQPDKTAPPTSAPPASTAAAVPSTTVPATTVPATTVPATTGPVTTLSPGVDISDPVDVGDAKPERFYDAYLGAALTDIDAWWEEQYPLLYGEPWEPLEGGVFAGYPERTDPIPGCGPVSETSYQEITDFGAFYCPQGDFMAYDDGELGVIYQLAEEFSPSVVAVVMAHEYGHAIQQRTGDLDRDIPTIYSEQQADCFSGAWARHVWNGETPGLAFGDSDIRTGLIALVAVADPIGTSVMEPGGHGSAFDRIGAFQEGFLGGPANCTDLIDKPLPLLPNEFAEVGGQEELTQGDAPFGWSDDQIMELLLTDLNFYWPASLTAEGAGTAPALTIRAASDPLTDHCGDPQGMSATGVVFCPETNEVIVDEVESRVLYDDFGDFAVGYLVGVAWAEGVQDALGSQLQGESRALASDCLVGAWVASAMRGFDPGTGETYNTFGQSREMTISPGDLDEAVQTVLRIGDLGLTDNLEGSAFEKIAAIRRGVINGLPTCLADLDPAGV
jgi:predicted metalloprotease